MKHRSLPKIEVGQPVIAKHKNGRFYNCRVTTTSIQVFYEVDFDDGSLSNDLYPEDIQVSICCNNILLMILVNINCRCLTPAVIKFLQCSFRTICSRFITNCASEFPILESIFVLFHLSWKYCIMFVFRIETVYDMDLQKRVLKSKFTGLMARFMTEFSRVQIHTHFIM